MPQVRIVRIAVHPRLQRLGYGSAALDMLIKHLDGAGGEVAALADPGPTAAAGAAGGDGGEGKDGSDDERRQQRRRRSKELKRKRSSSGKDDEDDDEAAELTGLEGDDNQPKKESSNANKNSESLLTETLEARS
eukprot:GHVT01033344.1.p2 GENE.GHVT01033344.1~~GHVT01033344.1.p2  ORF type:complete len:134 (-),score=37.63 GHVT01033344.1:59-460(-)